jgi:hypothetical protein
MADYNPYWFDPNNLPPEVMQQQVSQMQPLMGQMPQQMLGAPQMPMTIQVPDIQYSDAMKKQARGQGFMEAGLNLLANMKPTALPQSPFSAIGQAGLAGLQSYQGNLNNKMAQALEYAKMQRAMQPEIKTDHYTIREIANKDNIKSVRLASGQGIPPGWEIIQSQGEGVPSYFPFPFLGPGGEILTGERRKGTVQVAGTVPGTPPLKGPFIPAQQKLLPDDRAAGFGDAKTLVSNMKNISDTWDRTLTGPAQGNVNKAKSLVMNNPEFESLRAQLGQLRTIIYNISGKQINESELKWLDTEILPKLTNPDENFKAKLNQLNKWILAKAKNSASALKASQFNVPSEFMSDKYYYSGAEQSQGKSRYSKYGIKE